MKKRALSVLLAAAMVSTMLAGCSGGSSDSSSASADASATDGNVVKIGVYEPASGDNGAGGKQETLGIQYANKVTPTVEIGGTEYTVQLDIVDNESSNDKGPSAAATLVSDKVSVVLGSYGSGVSIAASDVFKEAGIPAIGVTCTNPQVTEGNTHYFRICFLDPFQGTVHANFAKDKFNAKKAYVLTKLGDDYSTGLGYYFTQAFEALGGEVVAETFQEGNSDFTSYITSAKKAGSRRILCSQLYRGSSPDYRAGSRTGTGNADSFHRYLGFQRDPECRKGQGSGDLRNHLLSGGRKSGV